MKVIDDLCNHWRGANALCNRVNCSQDMLSSFSCLSRVSTSLYTTIPNPFAMVLRASPGRSPL
jgi:hypothetical protein